MKIPLASCSTPLLLAICASPIPAQQAIPSFKAETNLVLVPVVVRDANGDAVANLSKDDFRLFDNGRERPITTFALEESSGRRAQDRSLGDGPKSAAVVMPEHFTALMFDDAHMLTVYARDALLKYLAILQPDDRVALFTSSGQFDVDFTADRHNIIVALVKMSGEPAPTIFSGMQPEHLAKFITQQCNKIIDRMSLLPGQRSLVFISSGLRIHGAGGVGAVPPWSIVNEVKQLVDHAIRSRVVINAMDTQGLSTTPPSGRAWEFQFAVTDGTGGKFIRNTNDLDGAIRQLAGTAKYRYILGFSPESTDSKTAHHKLEVKLREGHNFEVEARASYYGVDVPAPADAFKGTKSPQKADSPVYSEAETQALLTSLDIPFANPAAERSPVEASSTALPAAAKSGEMVTSDGPATFTTQSTLVEVPVVVRDMSGHSVGRLKQGDFHITDKGKPQDIARFAIVEANGTTGSTLDKSAPGDASPAHTAAVPMRFVAFVFDDVHMQSGELPQVRNAVLKYLTTSVAPQDRVALYTTSGRHQVEFTGKPDTLAASLKGISPSPIGQPDSSGCGAKHVSYFQAALIGQQVGLNPRTEDIPKSLPLRVAVQEFGDFQAAGTAVRDAYTSGLQESRAMLAALRAVVRRMAAMPGERSILLVSPGLFIPPDLQNENDELMALAIRSKVLINVVDARGVWTNSAFDACRRGTSQDAVRDEATLKNMEGQANTDELIALSEGTGGTTNFNNDFFGGIMKEISEPEYLYILAFAPQNLKVDGSFHSLKVTVAASGKLSVQARRGYWAPKRQNDEAEAARQEIENALFVRDEVHGLPVDVHTRWMNTGEISKLVVLAGIDLKLIHLRKDGDRNRNDLTIVVALFDSDGNLITGSEKIVELRLLDETVARLKGRPPAVIGTDFDVKPGAYVVRLVTRDEDGQITAENASVQVQ
jgi:VWFA-related protein